jgi:ABC-type bacteriocin/lantibiotic exporter with double-glycine peptidase domain
MTSRALVLLAALASGCSTAVGRPDAPDAPLAPEAVVLQVPIEAQRGDADCGLACLAALLRFHGLELDDEARRAYPQAPGDGVRASAIRDYLVGRGFRVHLVHGTLDDARPAGLLRVLDAGVPALVELSLPGGSGSHYVLVAGYDPVNRWLVVMDPAWGAGVVPYDRFEPLWTASERFMLVAAPAATVEQARAGR